MHLNDALRNSKYRLHSLFTVSCKSLKSNKKDYMRGSWSPIIHWTGFNILIMSWLFIYLTLHFQLYTLDSNVSSSHVNVIRIKSINCTQHAHLQVGWEKWSDLVQLLYQVWLEVLFADLRWWWVWAGIRPGRCGLPGRGTGGRCGCRSSGPSGADGGRGPNLPASPQQTESRRRSESAGHRSSPAPGRKLQKIKVKLTPICFKWKWIKYCFKTMDKLTLSVS